MLARLGNVLYRVAMRIVPDPFVLALGLSLLIFALAAGRLYAVGGGGEHGVWWTVLTGWADGFGSAAGLAFALQMCLILVTGHALALSPPVQRFVGAVAKLPRTAASASLVVAFVACAAAVVHWGLGAIVGAFLAREMARNFQARGVALHYPILGAAAYSGLAVWHGGLSGSAPLKVAEANHFVRDLVGVVPLQDTLLGGLNLVVTGVLVALIPVLYMLMTPRRTEDMVPPPRFAAIPAAAPADAGAGGLHRFQHARVTGGVLGLAGLLFVVAAVAAGRVAFDITAVILFFLFLGLLFHGSILSYADTVTDGARGAGPIILQFPFYFGILGMMRAGGLIEWISEGILSVSTAATFPAIAFWSAGLVNLFVPSGGGQWAVQANILLSAGRELGVPAATTVMAFAYGDAWTNMLQPFWALPLLGIMGLQARDIIGYTAVIFAAMGVLVTGALLLF